MRAEKTIRLFSDYSRILSQLLCDVIENYYKNEHAYGVLTKRQFTILKILSTSATYTVSEIADILHISRAAASKNIDKLVHARLVNRKITREDRRTMDISLTKDGSFCITACEKFRLQKQSALLANFSKQDKQKFIELIGKYVNNYLRNEENIDLICLQCKGAIEDNCSVVSKENRCRFYYLLNIKYHLK